MNCNIQAEENYSIQRSYDDPVFAGTVRFLLGLTLLFAGLYAVALSDFQGHGLGFFLILAAPFVIIKDDEKLKSSKPIR